MHYLSRFIDCEECFLAQDEEFMNWIIGLHYLGLGSFYVMHEVCMTHGQRIIHQLWK